MTEKVIPITPARSCGDCGECCKGWLTFSIFGQNFHPGRPCHYFDKKCTIYEDEARPKDPCDLYRCAWLSSDQMPLWMRPDKSKIIVTERTSGDVAYWDVVECGQKIDSEALSWLILWSLDHNINLQYRIHGAAHKIGTQEFLDVET